MRPIVFPFVCAVEQGFKSWYATVTTMHLHNSTHGESKLPIPTPDSPLLQSLTPSYRCASWPHVVSYAGIAFLPKAVYKYDTMLFHISLARPLGCFCLLAQALETRLCICSRGWRVRIAEDQGLLRSTTQWLSAVCHSSLRAFDTFVLLFCHQAHMQCMYLHAVKTPIHVTNKVFKNK